MITDKSCTMLIKHLLTHLMAIKTNKLKYIHSFSKKEIPKQRNDYDCGMLVCMVRKSHYTSLNIVIMHYKSAMCTCI